MLTRIARILGTSPIGLKRAFVIAMLLALTACGQKPKGISETEVFSTTALSEGEKPVKFRIETVATGLEVPWGLAFLPDGRILVTERPGRVRLIENGKLKPEPIFKVPDVEPSGESGLMDIALHPKFNENSFVYLAYAYRGDGKAVKATGFYRRLVKRPARLVTRG